MQQLLKECYGALRRNMVVGGIGVLIGFLLGLAAPGLGAFVSLGPLAALLICILPCLAPLLLLRRKASTAQPRPRAAEPTVQRAEDPVQAA